MLSGAIAAEGKVGLMMNVREDHLERVLSILPALQNPTISKLSDGHWVAVNTILDESRVPRAGPASQGGRCLRNCRVPAQQDHSLTAR